MPPAGSTGEIQVEAGICVVPPAVFTDEPPTYGQFPPFFDEFLAQLATDSMFDGVDLTLPYTDLEPLQL
ncbi:Hypothetical protein PHPALM_16739 [Phytophthora palmivora]|uniref:Uncharacterized protein n=1 Tax=Phytophthora palmivora TaxID=4796 RepID=A0A2P4XNZ3_9STRA|nr:Hypothetical protein PHPALM_19491 [Phytophthora palmivora]POM67295.1 Hypothetical protein PHPALM_16739 [Phytophthora palmivora]